MTWADPEQGREYYRQRYRAKRAEILAKRKAYYAEHPEAKRAAHRRYYRANRQALLALQRQKRIDDAAARPKRLTRERRLRFLRLYGVDHPEIGQASLDGTMHHRRCSSCPPTSSPKISRSLSEFKPKTRKRPVKPSTPTPRLSTAPSRAHSTESPPSTRSGAETGTTIRTSISTPPKSRWIPEMVSVWEPGLANQAYREFHT